MSEQEVLRGIWKLKLTDELRWLADHGYRSVAVLEALVTAVEEIIDANVKVD